MLHSGEFENPFADPRRDVSEFAGAHWDHPSVGAFVGRSELLAGLHTIAHNHVDIDVLFEPAGVDVTAVLFHGALPNSDVQLPVFADPLPGVVANRVYISDPGLALDPGNTWARYEDSNGVPLSHILPRIIRRFHEATGGTELVFAGVGEGAQVAERYAALVPGSRAATPETV